MTVAVARLQEARLDVAEILAAVSDDAAGGIALFCGAVRDNAPGVLGTVTGLDYSAHPDAAAVLARVAAEVAAAAGSGAATGSDGPAGSDGTGAETTVTVAVVHRTGALAVGDLAIVAAASAGHRGLAFDTCRTLVDRVKAEVPIWKREHVAGGGSHWVGLEAGQQP